MIEVTGRYFLAVTNDEK